MRARSTTFETRKYDAAILIGSDIPWLGTQHVHQAQIFCKLAPASFSAPPTTAATI